MGLSDVKRNVDTLRNLHLTLGSGISLFRLFATTCYAVKAAFKDRLVYLMTVGCDNPCSCAGWAGTSQTIDNCGWSKSLTLAPLHPEGAEIHTSSAVAANPRPKEKASETNKQNKGHPPSLITSSSFIFL